MYDAWELTLQAIVKRDFLHDLFVGIGVKRVCPVRMEEMVSYTVKGVRVED